ncbi:hypothetical protein [Haloarchaeobius iranensis]|uniref:SsDNA-binding replication factor A, large subunit n=1 Tax=Haloarchaeobius iranensis TaxID=996166 RepID=A0A1H0B2P8_9EURY|nr:hypothetical protein [Haloarchaeobius iranensis]SDN39886.1 hypothetical protein SAMN05192554_1339 [Haloarchaeobius iranensis]
MSSRNTIRDEGSDVQATEQLTLEAAVEDDGELLAEAACGDHAPELRPTVELEKQGRIDYDWSRKAGLDHPYGTTLEAEERRLAEEQELARQRDRALAAAEVGIDRESSCRVQTEQESSKRVRDFRERGVLGSGGDPDIDPRERLDAKTLGGVNRYGMQLAERFRGPSRGAYAKQLAEKVACQDMGLTAAVLKTNEELAKGTDAVQPIATLEEWMGHPKYSIQANVEAEVKTLYQPAAVNQQQVGVLDDGSGTAKLTIWKRSRVGAVLREGDRVRLLNCEVGWYGGDPTLAVTSESEVTVLEGGDGPSPRNGTVTHADFSGGSTEQRLDVLRD